MQKIPQVLKEAVEHRAEGIAEGATLRILGKPAEKGRPLSLWTLVCGAIREAIAEEWIESMESDPAPPKEPPSAPAEGVVPDLKTERPDERGVGYLRLKTGIRIGRTYPDINCNLDFDEDGELVGVEFMEWPDSVKQHPDTSQNEEVRSTDG